MKSYLAAALSAVTALYTIWYMHFDKPWTNAGALSTIGLEHRGLFVLWGVMTFAALAAGIIIGYGKIGKQKICIPLLALSALGMALTLCFKFEYAAHTQYLLHCAGSLIFSAITGFTIFLLFLLKRNKAFCAITAVILIADLICLLIFKETGLIETLPIFAGYILLSTDNIRSEKLEASRKTESA